jgi:hypothetical protein
LKLRNPDPELWEARFIDGAQVYCGPIKGPFSPD